MDILTRLIIALGSGMLIGFERELSQDKNHKLFAGARTYSLIALLGFLSAFLTQTYGVWIFVVALLGLIALTVVSYTKLADIGRIGATNEIITLLTFIYGALYFQNELSIGVACTVATTLLISLKMKIREVILKINQDDIYAFLKFVVMIAIAFPALPNQNFGPFMALNAQQIWAMVILISGISFGGYLLIKFIGSHKGLYWTAILGGVASSTAIAWDFTAKSIKQIALSKHFATGIIIASSIMFFRVFVLTFALNQNLAMAILPAMLIFGISGVIFAYIMYKSSKSAFIEADIHLDNPLNLSSAVKFAILFSLVQVFVRVADYYYGDSGVYIASAISGFTEVDAIVIAMSNRAIDAPQILVAQNSIIIATIANTLVKMFICVFSKSDKSFKKTAIIGFSVLLVSSLVYLIFNNYIL